jgi:hypothetical protein
MHYVLPVSTICTLRRCTLMHCAVVRNSCSNFYTIGDGVSLMPLAIARDVVLYVHYCRTHTLCVRHTNLHVVCTSHCVSPLLTTSSSMDYYLCNVTITFAPRRCDNLSCILHNCKLFLVISRLVVCIICNILYTLIEC